jgi:RNase adaptor protein for sRNA GlmZ degradation
MRKSGASELTRNHQIGIPISDWASLQTMMPVEALRLIDEAINKLRRADAAANELEITILEAARARLVSRFVQSRYQAQPAA